MGASVQPQQPGRIARNIEAMRSQGATDDDIEAYLTQHEGLKPEPASFDDVQGGAKSTAPKPFGIPKPDFKKIAPGVAANALNMAQGVPGAKAFEAAAGWAGSKLTDHPMSYKDSYDALTSMTDEIPTALKHAERIVGAGPLAAALPVKNANTAWGAIKGGAKVGARLGAADAALDANPDVSLNDRALNTAIGGGVGGAFGGLVGAGAKAFDKGRELNTLRKRVKAAPTLGASAETIDKDIATATTENYGKVREEAAANGGTSPGLKEGLNHPLVKPYVDIVRNSQAGKNASDAEVAQKARKLISRQRGGFKKKLALEYDANIDMQAEDLKEAAKVLDRAMSTPSQKPPLHLDIAGETSEVAPRVTPGRESMLGPMSRERPARTLPGHERVEGPMTREVAEQALPGHGQLSGHIPEGRAGAKMGEQAQVAVDPSGRVHVVSPRDVQGPAGPSFTLSPSPEQVVRPGVPSRPGFVLRGQPEQVVDPGAPARPAFQLRGQPEKVTPGVRIETPAMRVQTAPGEDVPAVAPSFPKAISEKARMEGERETFNTVSDATHRVMRGSPVAGKKLLKQSPEALQKLIGKMTPEETQKALTAVLGRAKEGMSIKPQQSLWRSLVELKGPATRLNRISPFVDQLDQKAGNTARQPMDMESVLRSLGILNAPLANR